MARKLINSLFLIIMLKISTIESAPDCEDKTYRKSFKCCIKNRTDLINAFRSVAIHLNCSSSKCTVSRGSPEELDENLPSWNDQFLEKITPGLKVHDEVHQVLYFHPFDNDCIKVDVPKNVVVKMQKRVEPLDMTYIVIILAGLILFFAAEKLSRSDKFCYTVGVVICVVGALKAIEDKSKDTFAYRENIPLGEIYRVKNRMVFFVYVGSLACGIFFALYWRGPIDARTRRIIQWCIQIIAVTLLCGGSQVTMVSCSLILCSVLVKLRYLNPFSDVFNSVGNLTRKLWKTKPKRLLTKEEYRTQGEVETKRALEELREFCNSPNCSLWKTVARIKSPRKFARFVSGESHVSDAEVTLHEFELSDSDSAENSGLISDADTEDSVLLPAN